MSDIVERLGNLIECEMDKAQCELYATAKAEIERLREEGTVELVKAMLEIERLTAALNEMRSRDERNGSLPPAYRMIIDDALEPKP